MHGAQRAATSRRADAGVEASTTRPMRPIAEVTLSVTDSAQRRRSPARRAGSRRRVHAGCSIRRVRSPQGLRVLEARQEPCSARGEDLDAQRTEMLTAAVARSGVQFAETVTAAV